MEWETAAQIPPAKKYLHDPVDDMAKSPKREENANIVEPANIILSALDIDSFSGGVSDSLISLEEEAVEGLELVLKLETVVGNEIVCLSTNETWLSFFIFSCDELPQQCNHTKQHCPKKKN